MSHRRYCKGARTGESNADRRASVRLEVTSPFPCATTASVALANFPPAVHRSSGIGERQRMLRQ
eukprot:4134754-Prymnesium_polylepis.2